MSKIIVALFALASCYAGQGNLGEQQTGSVKSLADAIQQKCESKYAYHRYELEGKLIDDNNPYRNTPQEKITLNIRAPKGMRGSNTCESLKEVTICIGGTNKRLKLTEENLMNTISQEDRQSVSEKGIKSRALLMSSKDSDGKVDQLLIYCEKGDYGDEEIKNIRYTAGIDPAGYHKGFFEVSPAKATFNYTKEDKEWYQRANGTKLESYQDSQCFPESDSPDQCSGTAQ